MRRFKEIVGDLFILAFVVVTEVMVIRIIATGCFWGVEDNPYILWGEAIGGGIVFLLFIDRIVDDLKKNRR